MRNDLKKIKKASVPKQSYFTWVGKDKNQRKISGNLLAVDETAARIELRKQGINVRQLKKQPLSLFNRNAKKINSGDIAIFARQLATMLHAGIPIVQSLDIVGRGHEKIGMRELLMAVKVDVESGDTLTQALRKHPTQFDELFCNLIEAGERGGVLEALLDKIAMYKEKSETMKKKIKKALTYPIVVVIIALIVTAILLIFVVPVFEELFKSFGADLPIFTQMVISLSKWLQTYWWVVASSIAGIYYTFRFLKQTSDTFNYFLDKQILKTKVIGVIVQKSAISRFARTLATMTTAGVPIVEALDSVAGTCGNRVYSDAVLAIREDVALGQRLQSAINETGLFPHMVIQMIQIGEESGALDTMLSKVADFYEEEVDHLVDNLSSLMEPMIMIILGILVGGLIVAMYLPIFKLGSAMH
jgi:type IV pilus assembly protein PilC